MNQKIFLIIIRQLISDLQAQKKDCCEIKSWKKHTQKLLMITRKYIFQKVNESDA